MKQILAVIALLAAAFVLSAAEAPKVVKDFSLPDADGKKHTSADWKGKKAIVLFILGTECPVSNFYAPEYGRLAKTFAEKGIVFYGIHPDPDVTAAVAAKHAADYHIPFPVLLDPTQAATRQTGAERLSTAVVLSPDGTVLYRGRIDDRYTAAGVRREVPTTRDLQDALTAVIEGKAIPVALTKAFGCPLPDPAKPK
jgi:peroxiredoxin